MHVSQNRPKNSENVTFQEEECHFVVIQYLNATTDRKGSGDNQEENILTEKANIEIFYGPYICKKKFYTAIRVFNKVTMQELNSMHTYRVTMRPTKRQYYVGLGTIHGATG